ncbi:zona pellucida sperm-binding protein 3-like, partial [Gymnodraco acuticeps]|uniref:Zona pellucida sperm-binding protein 3-like n=1 Tax=Gymnodraco acuticeps TaxID=8218 RepID=A0A6P8V1Z9_GYMAC
MEEYGKAISFLRDSIHLFRGLKIGPKGSWKPVQTGLVMATTTILEVQHDLLRQGHKFVLTSRFTQDCLENTFSSILFYNGGLWECRNSYISRALGEGNAEFNYKLDDCNFKRLMKGKKLLYKNELTFRPQPRSSPASYVYPIECVYPRPKGWIPPFLNAGSGVAEGRGGLKFHMLLLNERITAVAETNVIPLGSFMPIWATVAQESHQPLLLLMEECVAAATPELQANSNVYPIITNKGCLLDSEKGNSMFLQRYQSSAITLYLQSFKFGLDE